MPSPKNPALIISHHLYQLSASLSSLPDTFYFLVRSQTSIRFRQILTILWHTYSECLMLFFRGALVPRLFQNSVNLIPVRMLSPLKLWISMLYIDLHHTPKILHQIKGMRVSRPRCWFNTISVDVVYSRTSCMDGRVVLDKNMRATRLLHFCS